MTEDEMVGCHQRLNGHESGQTTGDSERQRKLGVLQFMGSQKVRQHLATDNNVRKCGQKDLATDNNIRKCGQK